MEFEDYSQVFEKLEGQVMELTQLPRIAYLRYDFTYGVIDSYYELGYITAEQKERLIHLLVTANISDDDYYDE